MRIVGFVFLLQAGALAVVLTAPGQTDWSPRGNGEGDNPSYTDSCGNAFKKCGFPPPNPPNPNILLPGQVCYTCSVEADAYGQFALPPPPPKPTPKEKKLVMLDCGKMRQGVCGAPDPACVIKIEVGDCADLQHSATQ